MKFAGHDTQCLDTYCEGIVTTGGADGVVTEDGTESGSVGDTGGVAGSPGPGRTGGRVCEGNTELELGSPVSEGD